MITWPMNQLTKQAGESRKLITHPKELISRGAIRSHNGKFIITDTSSVKIFRDRDEIPVFAEVKQQGHRHFYCRDCDGEYHMFGRRLNMNDEYPDIYEKLRNSHLPTLPKKTVIDCELIWPGHTDSEVPTALKNCPEELRIVSFAVPIIEGELFIAENSMSYKKGRLWLTDLITDDRYVIERGRQFILTKKNIKETVEHLLNQADILCVEGWVLKERACDGWWKLKGINEVDVFVTGFKVSDSDTRCGMITAVEIAIIDDSISGKGKERPLGRVSGFNEDEMLKMTRAYNKYGSSKDNPYYHKPLRVQYQEIAGRGKLKHAFFDSWREDKGWKDCTADQLASGAEE